MDDEHYEGANAEDLKGDACANSIKELATDLTAHGDADALKDRAHKTLKSGGNNLK